VIDVPEEYREGGVRLVHADCLDLLATLPDDSVDLIATDPPYYKYIDQEWDRQWATRRAFFDWLESVLVELQRVLRPTGSLYLFCSPDAAAKTEVLIGEYFRVLNQIVWRKPVTRHQGNCKEIQRKYFPQTERVIFAESVVPTLPEFHYESCRAHVAGAMEDAGVTSKMIDEATAEGMAWHYLCHQQYAIPSPARYEQLQRLAPTLKPFAELRAEYDKIRTSQRVIDARRDERRPFTVTKHVPHTDVWTIPAVLAYPGRHPCEKPLTLMRHIIEASSRPGDVVLDVFAGSGTTAIAAEQLGRQFVGCEMGSKEYATAVRRIQTTCAQRMLFN
jgi:adenine-specific DNA-methyltransferase